MEDPRPDVKSERGSILHLPFENQMIRYRTNFHFPINPGSPPPEPDNQDRLRSSHQNAKYNQGHPGHHVSN